MSHYKSNLRDVEFNLFEVFGRDKILGTGAYADLDVDTAKEILAEIDRITGRADAILTRSSRIVDRLLPLGPTPSGYFNPQGFIAASIRTGQRNDLFRAIKPRIATKYDERTKA